MKLAEHPQVQVRVRALSALATQPSIGSTFDNYWIHRRQREIKKLKAAA